MALPAPCLILDDASPGGRSFLFQNPVKIITADKEADLAAAFAALTDATENGYYAAGYFSYELGFLLEPKLRHRLPEKRKVPLLWFGIFKAREEVDAATIANLSHGRAYAGPLQYEWNEKNYTAQFLRAHEFIKAGDIYQTNLSQRARFSFAGDPVSLYQKLRATSQTSYCAYIDDGTRQILSLSPEKFFDISADGEITTRPMKGTAARHNNPQKDSEMRSALEACEKNRSENLMIVDLLRNDLGRIAETGSVRVENLFQVETYPTLHQMVSTVRAQLKKPSPVATVLRALFPCGSITGAPKIRAMEIIDDLEASPRGIYCGGIGFFAPDGSASFNVAIRTLTIENNRGELGIGSAVIYDSTAHEEYQECLLKAKYYEAARQPLELIETLRYTPVDGFTRLPLHLKRMANSANVFGITFNQDDALKTLHTAIDDTLEPLRVRLALNEKGQFFCRVKKLGKTESCWRYAISPQTMHSSDIFLQHKTNWRDIYESELRRLSDEESCDEILFTNENGEITEGARSNIFIRMNGKFITPALSCGLLNGCLRQEMIKNGEVVEGVLLPENLIRAETVYFGNSLRGFIQAVPAKSMASAA